MKHSFLPTLAVGIILIALAAAIPTTALSDSIFDRRSDTSISGFVASIDRNREEFQLRDGNTTYTVRADDAIIQLSNSRKGDLGDLREGFGVRVTGERLNKRTFNAYRVVITDDDNRYDNNRGGQSYRPDKPDKNSRIEGYVSYVDSRGNEIEFTDLTGKEYTAEIQSKTRLFQNNRTIRTGDIHSNDTIIVEGTLRDRNTVRAESIELLRVSRSYYNNNNRYGGSDIEGSVTRTASVFDRSIVVRTSKGDVRVDVDKDAQITSGRTDISVHDLRKDERIRIYGRWDGSTMIARRIDVISYARDEDYRPSSNWPDHRSIYSGRIISIDYRKHSMTVDAGGRNLKIDAGKADVVGRKSVRSFDDLRKGDNVSIRGDESRGTIKASTIELAY